MPDVAVASHDQTAVYIESFARNVAGAVGNQERDCRGNVLWGAELLPGNIFGRLSFTASPQEAVIAVRIEPGQTAFLILYGTACNASDLVKQMTCD
jgi:hypothetical protein